MRCIFGNASLILRRLGVFWSGGFCHSDRDQTEMLCYGNRSLDRVYCTAEGDLIVHDVQWIDVPHISHGHWNARILAARCVDVPREEFAPRTWCWRRMLQPVLPSNLLALIESKLFGPTSFSGPHVFHCCKLFINRLFLSPRSRDLKSSHGISGITCEDSVKQNPRNYETKWERMKNKCLYSVSCQTCQRGLFKEDAKGKTSATLMLSELQTTNIFHVVPIHNTTNRKGLPAFLLSPSLNKILWQVRWDTLATSGNKFR